tara:strand:+ start:1281 stop:2390 length:1110 start_codon:yes stop_codon:yes gene_type:complete
MYVIHYDEIGLKGNNRRYFENQLVRNLKQFGDVVKKRSYITLDSSEDVKDSVALIPGVAYFGVALEAEFDLNDVGAKVLELLRGKDFASFRINTVRRNKKFSKTSREVNEILGGVVLEKYDCKVDLKNASITVYVEVCDESIFIYTARVKGVGGLPVGSAGRVVSLLSGGLDSPVASFQMMKRGAVVVFVHFVNKTQQSCAVKDKISELVNVLSKVQRKCKLYMVPFDEIQQEIIAKVDSKFRMIVYRRFMMRIASLVAEKEHCMGLVTGDSLSQVASQTVENLDCVYSVVDDVVLSPLIGMNKEEIVNIARRIGTYDVSILPYGDCCSFLIAKHPVIKGKREQFEKIDSELDLSLVEKAFEKSDKIVL